LVYTGDTGYSKEIVEQYKKADIIILNLVYPANSKEKDSNNLNFEDAQNIIQKTKPRLVVITHFGKKMLDSDPLDEARELQRATGVQVLAATEGMSINPESYSAGSKQRTLGVYKESRKEELDEELGTGEEKEEPEKETEPEIEEEQPEADEPEEHEIEIQDEEPVEEEIVEEQQSTLATDDFEDGSKEEEE
jgi:hypothetical protein